MALVAILVCTALILVNAVYVAAEFSAVSVRRARIQQMAADGHPLASWLLPMLQSPAARDRYIGACQIGITLSSLILGAYAQSTFAVWLTPYFASIGGLQNVAAQSTSTAVVLLLLTVGQVIFGEQVPKSLALQRPTYTALYTLLPMLPSQWVFRPFIKWLNGTSLLLLRLLGVSPLGHRHIHSPEEIELLIAESHDGGLLEPDELRRLQRALRFSLRTAAQLMTTRDRMQAIDVTTPVEQVLALALESSQANVPVYRDTLDTVVGFLNTKRLLVRHVEDRPIRSLREELAPALTVDASMTGDRLLAELRRRRAHQAIVVDDRRQVVGMVTLDDILSSLLGPTPDEFTQSTLRIKAPRATRSRS